MDGVKCDHKRKEYVDSGYNYWGFFWMKWVCQDCGEWDYDWVD